METLEENHAKFEEELKVIKQFEDAELIDRDEALRQKELLIKEMKNDK